LDLNTKIVITLFSTVTNSRRKHKNQIYTVYQSYYVNLQHTFTFDFCALICDYDSHFWLCRKQLQQSLCSRSFTRLYLSFIIGFSFSASATASGISSGITVRDDFAQLCNPIVYFISTTALHFIVRCSPPIVSLRKNKKKEK